MASEDEGFGRIGEGIEDARSVLAKADNLLDRIDKMVSQLDALLDGGIAVKVGPDGSIRITPVKKPDAAS